MAAELLSYSGIVTKTKAMSASLLTDNDYEKIVSFSNVSEIIGFLKEHNSYKELFKDKDLGIHRGEIEHELIHSSQLSYAKLFRFARDKQRKAIQILFCKFEINIIKLCLQNLVQDKHMVDLSLFKVFFERHSRLDLDSLNNQMTIESLVEALKGTDYYAVLKEVEEIVNPTLFDYETRLDIYYFEKLWRMKDEFLSKKERKAYTEVIGQDIDMMNLIWIYRFKKFFDADSGKIMQSIIPIQYKISKKVMADLVAAENTQVLKELVSKTYYRKLLDGEDEDEVEMTYRKALDKLFREKSTENAMTIIPIYYHIYLKGRELDKLTTALECVRYKLPVDVSLKMLKRL